MIFCVESSLQIQPMANNIGPLYKAWPCLVYYTCHGSVKLFLLVLLSSLICLIGLLSVTTSVDIIDSNSIMVNQYSYSRAEFLHLKSNFLQPPSDVWKTINLLGIRSPQVKPPTHRGVKAGKRRQKQIKVVSTNSSTTRPPHVEHYTNTKHGRNLTNLKTFPRVKPLRVHTWNARSIGNKTDILSEHVLEYDVDIMFINETWLDVNDSVIIGECTLPGYDFISIPRGTDPHGGIGVLFKKALNLVLSHTGFESLSLFIVLHPLLKMD